MLALENKGQNKSEYDVLHIWHSMHIIEGVLEIVQIINHYKRRHHLWTILTGERTKDVMSV